MAKLTLTDIENLNNENSVITAINNNSAAIETALEKTLSRDGTSPNTMSAQLDMNSNKIVNVGTPTTSTDAVRLHELTDAESTIGGYAADAANSATAAATSASSAASSAIGASSSASAASASASNAATSASNAAISAADSANSATSASNSATAAQGYAATAATLVSDGDKGDITISSTGTVYTVDNSVITYAKIQNVSATDKLLGRSSAGAGTVEEIVCTSYGRALIDDTSTSAQRTTLGLGDLAVLSNITSSYVTDFNESVDDRTAALLQAGPNITLTYNDTLNTLTIAAAGIGGGATISDGDYTDVAVSSSGTVFKVESAAGNFSVTGTTALHAGTVIGASYAGVYSAPSNGLLIQGNVGIGTTGPVNKLDVSGAVTIGSGYAGVVTAPSNGLLVQGKVGINTGATVAYTFSVNGNIYSSAVGGSFIFPAGSGYEWWIGSYTDYTSYQVTCRKISDASYIVPFTILTNGNVGIGTASPVNKLDVYGAVVIGSGYAGTYTAPSNGLLVQGSVGIGTTNPGAFRQAVEQSRSGGNIISWRNTHASGLSGVDFLDENNVLSGFLYTHNGNDTMVMQNYQGGSFGSLLLNPSGGNIGIGKTSPTCTVDIAGNFGRGAPVTKTGNFTWATTESWIIVNNSGGSTTVTLPTASSFSGRELMVHTTQAQTVVSASSNVVPLAGGAAGTAILSATAGKWAQLVSDGTNWIITQAG